MRAKWILPLSIALSGLTNTFAANTTVADLMYVVPAGNFLSETSLSMSSSDFETKIGSSTNTSKTEEKQTVIQESFRFGIMSDLEMGVTLGYLFGGEKEVTLSGGDPTTSKFSGLRDIEINSKYRLFHSADFIGNLDLKASFSPSLGDQEFPTTTEDGNAFRGGHKLSLGAELGSEMTTFAWSIGADFNILMEQTLEDPRTGEEESKNSSRSDFYLYSKGQIFIMETHSLDFGLAYEINAAFDNTTTSNSAKTNYESSSFLHVSTAFNFNVDKDFYITPFIDYAFGADLDYKTDVASDITNIERKKFEMGVTVKYQF